MKEKRARFAWREPEIVDCIVIGGVADGLTIRGVRANAEYIRLSRPTAVKPLQHSLQTEVDVERETDIYKVNVISLQAQPDETPRLYGLCIVETETLSWGFERLLIHYAKTRVQRMMEENREAIMH